MQYFAAFIQQDLYEVLLTINKLIVSRMVHVKDMYVYSNMCGRETP